MQPSLPAGLPLTMFRHEDVVHEKARRLECSVRVLGLPLNHGALRHIAWCFGCLLRGDDGKQDIRRVHPGDHRGRGKRQEHEIAQFDRQPAIMFEEYGYTAGP